MIFNTIGDIRDDRTCKALTGLTRNQFQELLKMFEASHTVLREELYEQGAVKVRHIPGDRGYLKTLEQRLFFLLYYLKNYPTYDVLGYLFGFSGGHAYGHLQQLIPVLRRTLAENNHLPLRILKDPESLNQAIDNKGKIIIDATERTCVRPQDKIMQKARYSGKKNIIP